ncbi:DUF5789 family protein [Halostella litorea]|uniref:DUF5789 family protein n=1 Tax=Halostella litorea TaxID=2528831 RepID=UPI001092F5E6|nr:DUF2795 domain-containing protein [Halostella litorea]
MLHRTTDRLFDDADYPLTTEQFVARHGDEELELPNGSETLGEVLGRTSGETYEAAEDARFAVYNALSSKAIGRKGYSDRDPTPPGSPHGPDQVSF